VTYDDPAQQQARDRARGEQECHCGHEVADHRELDRDDPAYKPTEFHCHIEGCSCVVGSMQEALAR
jgi:hypothetical protein